MNQPHSIKKAAYVNNTDFIRTAEFFKFCKSYNCTEEAAGELCLIKTKHFIISSL